MTMKTMEYQVSFTTPAFLGDAEQNGRWRTPPFKALLRQWWRVAMAKNHDFRHQALRAAEGRLFGNAWIESTFCKSKVRLRLDRWDTGQLKRDAWVGKDEKKLTHPEVTNKEGKAIPVGAELYLGYGPLSYDKDKKATVLRVNAAIQAEKDSTKLHLAWPDEAAAIPKVMQLIHWFGTVGGRSRNGWGSLELEGVGLKGLDALTQSNPLLNDLARPLDQCLQLDWPHATGRGADGRLLIWTSKQPFVAWRDAMVELARVKIEFRARNQKLSFDAGRIGPKLIDRRHILAYPVTNHSVSKWEKYKVGWSTGTRNGRLANQLRFKVARNTQGKFVALAYHLPCGLPAELLQTLTPQDREWIAGKQLDVWRSVHDVLDRQMQRIA